MAIYYIRAMINRLISRLLILATALAAVHVCALAQRNVSVLDVLDRVPRYWNWADPYDGTEFNRVYRGGGMVCMNMDGGSRWSFRPVAAKPESNWQATLTYRADHSTADGSCGMLVGLPNMYAFFMVEPVSGKAHAYVYDWVKKEWTTSAALKNANGKSVSSPTPIGADNAIEVRKLGSKLTMSINNQVVYSWDVKLGFPECASSVTAFGLAIMGKVTTQFRSLSYTFTPPDFNFYPDALKGASKTFADELNAGKSDRFAVIAPNGQSLYFIRTLDKRSDDIISATRQTDSSWTNVQPIGYPLNNTTANNVVSVSQDDNELMVFGKYKADGSWAGSGFSKTSRTAMGWSMPKPIEIEDYRNVASTREECVSPDSKVMILSCQRDSTTYSSKDLHVSFLKQDGSYSVPVRLPKPINSDVEDGMPYIAADGRTLYFGSGRPGFGDMDVWVTKRLDETWMKWSDPINMGPNVNTSGWDGYFTVHPSGKYAYMNSSDGYRRGLVRVTLPRDEASKALLPDPLVVVTGRVTNGRTGEPIGTTIRIAELNSSKPPTQAVSEPGNGEYSIVLPGGTDYAFYAEREGFFPVSENLELSTLGVYQEIRRDLTLYPIEVGSVIRLNNVFFDTDKWDLRAQSSEELMRLAEMLKQRPTVVIEVGGHTDDRASDAHNKTLSTNRSQAVVAFLSKNGVAPSQMTAVGYGKTKPVATGTTDEARQRNRRVEITVAKQ